LIEVDSNQQVLLDEPEDVKTCGFSPDDRIVLLHPSTEGDGFLELVDVHQPEDQGARYRIPYNGECPIWLH
jgi:hypothetical protein